MAAKNYRTSKERSSVTAVCPTSGKGWRDTCRRSGIRLSRSENSAQSCDLPSLLPPRRWLPTRRSPLVGIMGNNSAPPCVLEVLASLDFLL